MIILNISFIVFMKFKEKMDIWYEEFLLNFIIIVLVIMLLKF